LAHGGTEEKLRQNETIKKLQMKPDML